MNFNIYSSQVGEGSIPVVFLHGLFGQGRNWFSVAKSLSDVATSLLVDAPNHGHSDWTSHFSYDNLAQLIHNHVIHQPAFEQGYMVVGHSMGGKIAMKLALNHANYVTKLVVAEMAPVNYPKIGNNFEDLILALTQLNLGQLQNRGQADELLSANVANPTVRAFLLQNLHRESSAGSKWSWRMNLKMLGSELDQIRSWSNKESDNYQGSVMWLAGDNSDYIKPEYLPTMRKLFPKVNQVTIKNAGHWIHADQQLAVISTLRSFISLSA